VTGVDDRHARRAARRSGRRLGRQARRHGGALPGSGRRRRRQFLEPPLRGVEAEAPGEQARQELHGELERDEE